LPLVFPPDKKYFEKMQIKNNHFFSIQNYLKKKNIMTKTDCPIKVFFTAFEGKN